MRLQDVDPAEYRALVVARAATDESAGLLVDGQHERLGVPSVALQRLVTDAYLVWE